MHLNMHLIDEKLNSNFSADDDNHIKLLFTGTRTGNKD